MKTTLLTLFYLLVTIPLFAQQTFKWSANAGGPGTDIINDIYSMENDIYITGRFSDTFFSGNQKVSGENMTDIYLARLNKDGKTLWVKSLTGEGVNNSSCIAGKEETIYAGGTVSGNIKNGKERFDGEGTGVFVSAWNKRGSVNWLTRLPYQGHATLDVLETAPDGTLLAGGLFQGLLQAGDKKLNSPGSKRAYWVKLTAEGRPFDAGLSAGEGSHRLVSAVFDIESNLYQLFSVSGNFAIDTDTVVVFPRSMKSGLVVTKETPDGKREWIKSVEGTGYNEGVKILSGNNNELVICTNFNQEIKLQDTLLNTNSQLETALIAWNSSGEFQWVKTISSPVKARAMDVMYTRHGNLLVSGYFRNSYTIEKEQFFSDVTEENIFLLQLDANGELVWHDEPGQDASGFCKAMTLDESGNIIFAGGFRGELKIRNEQLKSAGKEDVLIAKYFNCLQKEIAILGERSLCQGGETELTVSGDFNTYLWNGEEWGEKRIMVNEPGTYNVTAFDRQGCAASDTVEVITLEEVQLGLPEQIELFPDDKIYVSADDGYLSYNWNDGVQSAAREVIYAADMDSALLYLTALTYKGCIVSDTIKVKYNHASGRLGTTGVAVTAWPNPVQGTLLWYINPRQPENIIVTLTDSKSTLLLEEEVSSYIPGTVRSVDMSHLTSGNYILSIKIKDIRHHHKIVKK